MFACRPFEHFDNLKVVTCESCGRPLTAKHVILVNGPNLQDFFAFVEPEI